MIDRITITTDPATGGDGSATDTSYSPHISGEILAVTLEWNAGVLGTADTTMWDTSDPAETKIVNLNNPSAYATRYRPYENVHTNNDFIYPATFDGTYPIKVPYAVNGRLALKLANANNDDTVTAHVWYRR